MSLAYICMLISIYLHANSCVPMDNSFYITKCTHLGVLIFADAFRLPAAAQRIVI